MKVVNLSDAGDGFSRYVAEARRGGRVRILVRGRPVADLVPISPGSKKGNPPDPWLDEPERLGWIRRGRGKLPAELFLPGPRVRAKPLSETVIEERRAGQWNLCD